MMHPALSELLLKEQQRDLERRVRSYATRRRTPTKQSGALVLTLDSVHLSDGPGCNDLCVSFEETATASGAREPIDALTEEASNLAILTARLSREAETVRTLREQVVDIEKRTRALLALQLLEPSVSAALADVLVPLALSHRHALRVRQLLARMSHREATQIVTPLVADLLDDPDEADGDAFRRLAELLEYLGLDEALDDLVKRAARSDDPDVREVADDFGLGL